MDTILQHIRKTGNMEWTLEDRANYLLFATEEQARAYSRLSRIHYKAEREILEKNSEGIVSGFGSALNVIGLASGASERESIVVQAALRAGKSVRYFAVDKSFAMLELTYANVPAAARIYCMHTDLFNLDLAEIARETRSPNLVLFSGYTTFNFSRTKALRYLEGNLSPGDAAVITAGLLPRNIEQIISDYTFPEFLEWTILPITYAGFLPQQLEYKAVFDENESCVKFSFVIKDASLLKQSNIREGDSIVLAKSLKLPLECKNGYLSLIERYLKVDNLFTEPTGMTAVVKVSAKS